MKTLTPMERVLTALSHREPDRVPVFLLLTMHGAREVGVPLRDYFERPDHLVEGQLRLRARFGHDCLYSFHYASVETEAFGGEVLRSDDGPPNAGAPLVRDVEDILALAPPRVEDAACLQRVLEATSRLRERARGEVPIIGVVMSPFSMPIMQLGFERYIEVLFEREDLFAHLMQVNEAFCVAWANAQLAAGATAICYFDPMSSPTMTAPGHSRRTGFAIAKRTLARLDGPAATHFASGRVLPVIEDLVATGTAAVGTSADDDLAAVKAAAAGRLTVLGNLNGIAMRRWTPEEAREEARIAIAAAAAGGGFILSDNHGEIPFQVQDDTLHAIMDAAREHGRSPVRARDEAAPG